MICGQNEFGKSTIVSFIYAMLYGFGTKTKGRDDYLPWDGTYMAGEMVINLGGRSYSIYRKSGKTRAQDKLVVIDVSTGEKCLQQPEQLIDIPQDIFLKTLYITQISAQIPKTKEDLINQRLMSLAQSGDENTDFKKAVVALEKARTTILPKRGGGGTLNALQIQRHRLDREREEQKVGIQEYMALQEKLEQNRALLPRLKQRYEECVKRQLYDEYYQSYNRHVDFVREQQRLWRKLDEYLIFKREPTIDLFQRETIQRELLEGQPKDYEDSDKGGGTAKWFVFSFLLVILGVTLIIAPGFMELPLAIPMIASGGFCVLSAVGFLAYGMISIGRENRRRKKIYEYVAKANMEQQRIRQELAVYNCHSLGEYTEKKSMYQKLSEQLDHLTDDTGYLGTKQRIIEKYGGLEEHKYVNDIQMEETSGQIRDKIMDVEKEIGFLDAVLKERKRNVTPIDELERRIEDIDEKIKKQELYLEALELAILTINQSVNQLRQDFSPKLNMLSGEILGKITGGAHKEIIATKDFDINVYENGYRSLSLFSAGTCEQVYLSLRLALIMMLYPDGVPTIILDEPFARYDRDREEMALEYLGQINGQVIIFTCR